MKNYIAKQALLPQGWAEDVRISVDDGGMIRAVSSGAEGTGSSLNATSSEARKLNGPVIPGMPNLHSHAFQRAMAGLTEVAANPEDSFWTWRELMYRLVGRLLPDQVEAIARYLYIDMLKAGYTSVAEFHYLHHDLDGQPYANPAEMAERILAAADGSGIAVTLLPVMYVHGGFGGKEPAPGQRRFIHETDGYLSLLERLAPLCASPARRLGACFHSLRAVTPAEIDAIVAATRDGRPVHIHIAEQQKEVDDCIAWSGQRPIEWLYDHAKVDERWCLIHATHADDAEVALMAKSGAVVGICPSTEANLGDGLFPAISYAQQGGRFGIGSDSHVSLSVVEELRWLEYGQRLVTRHRNVAARHEGDSVGETLWRAALRGGAQASGLPTGELRDGARADLIVLDESSPLLAARDARSVLDGFLFAGNTPLVRHVMTGGRWQVRDFVHRDQDRIAARYREAVSRLR